MRNFYSILIFIAVLLTCIPRAFAQQDDAAKQQLKSIEIAYIARTLDLTPDEAQKFWPVYNNYRGEIDQLIADKQRNKKLNDKAARGLDADAIARSNMDKDLGYDKRMLDIKTRYTAEFQRVLPARKASAVFSSEQEFRRMMIRHLNSNKRAQRINQQQFQKPKH
ncbi:hypothetical protein SAMN05444266_101854 [Chitinophaga jiangningensis]|uniref:LTXXQ motif family protein n=1 Tax=Chitinophaga jiangningensis TaxID=1419482 RepID=A0A1M6X1M4_9BACT|nr:hypothetical protein [Chitinophaga jiangningensis]SHK99836.1 hypothetical protein SAMN05444266_101854 [Chitinophaga jiangningensis]